MDKRLKQRTCHCGCFTSFIMFKTRNNKFKQFGNSFCFTTFSPFLQIVLQVNTLTLNNSQTELVIEILIWILPREFALRRRTQLQCSMDCYCCNESIDNGDLTVTFTEKGCRNINSISQTLDQCTIKVKTGQCVHKQCCLDLIRSKILIRTTISRLACGSHRDCTYRPGVLYWPHRDC